MRHEREDSVTTKLTYLLIGGGIGAVLALLFAPKSGYELREDIADATRKGIDRTRETAAQLQERAGEYYEVSREKAGELYATAQEKAGEYVEMAKGAVAQSSSPITAAIEAGKQAYKEEKQRTETSAITEGRPTYPVKKKGTEAPSQETENQ